MLNKCAFFLIASTLIFSCAKSPSLELQPQNEKADAAQKQTGSCGLFFEVARLCLELIWDKIPTETEQGSFIIKYFVQEKPAKFIDPRQETAVVLAMANEEHEAPSVKITKVKEGEYNVENVFFDRNGEWQIRIQLKNGNKVVDQVIKKIKIK